MFSKLNTLAFFQLLVTPYLREWRLVIIYNDYNDSSELATREGSIRDDVTEPAGILFSFLQGS